MVAHCRDSGCEEGHTRVEACCGEGLSAALAASEDDEGLSVPVFLGGEEVNGADDPEEHSDEVMGIPVGDPSEAVIFQGVHRQAVRLSVVVFGWTSVRDAVGVDVHGEEAFLGPGNGSACGGASDAGTVEGEDCGF